jgi:hypothetical protein
LKVEIGDKMPIPAADSACNLQSTPSAAPAAEPGEHNLVHGGFEQPMGPGQAFVQTRALLQFRFIQRRLADNHPRCLAAGGAHGVDFKCDSGRAANRECCVTFA